MVLKRKSRAPFKRYEQGFQDESTLIKTGFVSEYCVELSASLTIGKKKQHVEFYLKNSVNCLFSYMKKGYICYILHILKNQTMRKITQLAIITVLLLSGTRLSLAQESSRLVGQGKIVFEISYPNSTLDEQSKAMLPTESVVYFKGNMSCVEVSMGVGNTTVITDHKLGESTALMDILGNKTAVKSSKADAQTERSLENKPVVELKPETKMIAGYTCKKAVVTSKGTKGDVISDVWYTSELMARNSFQTEIDGIDGFMLEFQAEQNGMTMKMTAKHVIEQNVEDSKFITPEGYTLMTKEQVQQMYGGGK